MKKYFACIGVFHFLCVKGRGRSTLLDALAVLAWMNNGHLHLHININAIVLPFFSH